MSLLAAMTSAPPMLYRMSSNSDIPTEPCSIAMIELGDSGCSLENPPEIIPPQVQKYAKSPDGTEAAVVSQQKTPNGSSSTIMHPCAIKATKKRGSQSSLVPPLMQSGALRIWPPEIPSAFTTFRSIPPRDTNGVSTVGVNRKMAAATLNASTGLKTNRGANVCVGRGQRLQLQDVDTKDRRLPGRVNCTQGTKPDRAAAVQRATVAVDVSEVVPLLGNAANWDDPGDSDTSENGRAANRKNRRKRFNGICTNCASFRQDNCSIM